MKTRYSVWMDGISLHDIDPSIYILDIQEQTPKLEAHTASKGMGDGMRLLRIQRQSLSVGIRFAIRERDTERRRDICSRVIAWARDGYLTTSDRPGQRLRVACTRFPTAESALKWTATLEMLFTAYDMPWWEAETPSSATYSGAHGNVVLNVDGYAESLLEASVTAEGEVSSMTIHANGGTFTFADLGLAAGDEMTISHDERGILSIMKGDTSMLGKRTAASADELTVNPGGNTIYFTADASCTAVFSARGRYT
ncbi:MAG: hypothetical protein ACI4WX_12285 [Aristaeellaceae bacterium]